MISVTVRCANTGKILDQFTMGRIVRRGMPDTSEALTRSRHEVITYLESTRGIGLADIGKIKADYDYLAGCHVVRLFLKGALPKKKRSIRREPRRRGS